jgi:hypothetical protein
MSRFWHHPEAMIQEWQTQLDGGVSYVIILVLTCKTLGCIPETRVNSKRLQHNAEKMQLKAQILNNRGGGCEFGSVITMKKS